MGRVLFGSEFGANLGHIYPMKRIADRLAENGHEIVFAARNLVQTKRALKDTDFKLVQAPFWINLPSRELNRKATPSYADVMARQGFGFKDNLHGYIGAWFDLVDLIDPDLVIADHSPGLSAAIRRRCPMINMGNGFTLPPSNIEVYPPVIANGEPLAPQAKLLEMFNDVLTEIGAVPLERLPQIFDTEGQYVCTVPQLDPYAEYRDQAQIGPLEDSLAFKPLPKSDHVFLYMAHEAGPGNAILKALQALKVNTTAYIRDARPEVIEAFNSTKITMLRQPASFAEIIPRSSMVIHSGGGGTSTACLMTGRPQVTFPGHSETALNSALMKRQGCAVSVTGQYTVAQITALLGKAIKDPKLKANAQRVARSLEQGNWKNALQTILDHAEQLISTGNNSA